MQYPRTRWTKVEAEPQMFSAGHEVTRRVRSAWMVFYTVKGDWEISVPGFECKAKAGDLVWIPSGLKTDQYYIKETTTLTLRLRTGAWVPHAEGDREAVILREKIDNAVRRLGPVLPLARETAAELYHLLQQMVREWSQPSEFLHAGMMKSYAFRLLYGMTQDERLRHELLLPSLPNSRKDLRDRMAPALQLLNQRQYLATGTCTVEALAKACGYKGSRFHTLFVQTTGLTPNRYLTERRVALACQLLMQPDTSILDAAYGSGFATQSRFYLAFKQITGMTPTEWRRQQKEP